MPLVARCAIAVAALLCFCGERTRAEQISVENSACAGAAIERVVVESAVPVDRREVQRAFGDVAGRVVSLDEIASAKRRIELTGLYESVSVVTESRGESCVIVVALVRWPIVSRTEFDGQEALSADVLADVARLPTGLIARADVLAGAENRLAERYREEGFPRVTVAVEPIPLGDGEALIRIRIVEGQPTTILTIGIHGDLPLSEEELLDAANLYPGDRYTEDRVREAESKMAAALRRAEYYEAVVVPEWQPNGSDGHLEFGIFAGPRFTIEIHGNRWLDRDDFLALGRLEDRVVVTNGTWRDLARRAQRAYEEGGYYFANVKVARIASVRGSKPTKRVVFEVEEGKFYRLDRVDIDGIYSVPQTKVRNRMDTRPPSWVPWRSGIVVRETIDADLERIERYYARHGFLNARARLRRVEAGDSNRLKVDVAIEERERTVIDFVHLDSDEALPVGIAPLLAAGDSFDEVDIEQERVRIQDAIRAEGYFDAKVTAEFHEGSDASRPAVGVTFRITAGPQQEVGEIVVRGNADTRAQVVLRELPFRVGDRWTPALQVDAQRKVFRTGLFGSVVVAPDKNGDPKRRTIVVDVKERLPGSLQWGVGYNTRDGFNGFGQVGYSNVSGLARRVGLRGELSVDPKQARPSQYLAEVSFSEPRVFNTQWTGRLSVIAERRARKVDQYSVERLALNPAIERTVGANWRFGAEWVAETARVFDISSDLEQEPGFDDERRLLQNGLGPFLIHDLRDDPLAPTSGSFQSIYARLWPGILGSEVPLVKITAHHSQYVPLWFGVVGAYALRAGWARTFDGSEQVPIRDRFFLGGRTTVRGFGENQVGPRAGRTDTDKGSPLGGDVSANTNVELIVPVISELRGVVFFDTGLVALQDRGVDLTDVRESAGIGVRYHTPVGALALEYGFKLDRRSRESPGAIHFSIGAIF